MYKVWQIGDGMIIWKGDICIGIKGMTLPKIFDDCDCYKLMGNAFDYALSPNNEYSEEQLAYINKAKAEWLGEDQEQEPEEESPYGIKYSEDEDVPLTDLLKQDIPDDDLPF